MYNIEEITRALSSAFLHSLWQGAILLLVSYTFSWLLRKSSARTRYHILCFLLLTFLAGFLGTFISNLNAETAYTAAGSNDQYTPEQASTAGSVYAIITSLLNWIDQHSIEIFFAWLFIFLTRLLFTMRSISHLHTIRKSKSTLVGEAWQQKLSQLANALKIKTKILLKETGQVSQPMVVGFIKPVILFPAGLVNHLSVSEIESILLHELAHIRRRDFLVNLAQHLIESVFFFNPFVTLLSRQLRNEREFCCDEMVTRRVHSKEYLQAILAFLEYQSGNHQTRYAVNFAGQSTLMKRRVNRILGLERNEGNGNILGLLACLLGISVLLSFTVIKNNSNAKSLKNNTENYTPAFYRMPGDATIIPVGTTQKITLHEPPPVSKQLTLAATDTIPSGLPGSLLENKDFMAGYKAGMSYRSRFIETGSNNSTASEKFELEIREKQSLERSRSDTSTHKYNPSGPDFLRSKRSVESRISTGKSD